jgi:invasion protein IalB
MTTQHCVRQDKSISARPALIIAAALLLTGLPESTRSEQGATPGQPPAAKAAEPEVAPRDQRPPREIKYGEWRKLCFKAAGMKAVCRTTITGTFETGQTAVRVDLIEREGDGAARLQLFLPVGLYLQSGVRLTIDQGSPHQIPYVWCLTNACVAGGPAEPRTITELETGQRLSLEVVDANLLTVTTSLQLNRFAAVRNGAPTRTYEQNIDE